MSWTPPVSDVACLPAQQRNPVAPCESVMGMSSTEYRVLALGARHSVVGCGSEATLLGTHMWRSHLAITTTSTRIWQHSNSVGGITLKSTKMANSPKNSGMATISINMKDPT